VDIQLNGSDPAGIQLWVCVKSAPSPKGGADWARLLFDTLVQTPVTP
jgi:hypothetical protein